MFPIKQVSPKNDDQFYGFLIIIIPTIFILIIASTIISAQNRPVIKDPIYIAIKSFKVGESMPSSYYTSDDYYYFGGFSPEDSNVAVIQKQSLYWSKGTVFPLYLSCIPGNELILGYTIYTFIEKSVDGTYIIFKIQSNFKIQS